MDLSSLADLLSPQGQQALGIAVAREPRQVDFLAHLTALSRIYPPALARPALETAILRQLASSKFPAAALMYFTRQALEQASSHPVAAHRARRFASYRLRLDLGCSIGGDTLALAETGPVIAIDNDPLRLRLAQENLLAVLPDREAHFVRADLTNPLPFRCKPHMAIFFDPGRRSQSRRLHSVRLYQPPLSIIHGWLPQVPSIAVKLSPGVDLAELAEYDAEVEFVSLQGELKEAVLWFGPLKTARRRATLLPALHTLASEKDDKSFLTAKLPLSQPKRFLYEPDPAVLRAGLVRLLGAQMGAAQLDPDIAYLTCDDPVDTPFARGYPVEDWLPFSLKHLRAILRQRGIEAVVVKKRGSPIAPAALIHDLRLKEGSGNSPDERLVFLTHLRGQPIAVICLPRL